VDLDIRGFCPGKSKKAQLAAFIIIGILVLAMAGAILYLVTSAKKTEAELIVEKGMEVSLDETKIREYITACIQKEGRGLVDKIGLQGGTLNLDQFRYYFNMKYNYHCYAQDGFVCVNRLVTRNSMAQELNAALKNSLKKCVNFENFRKQGYDVKEQDMDVKTIVGVDDVDFEVIYPITISKDNNEVILKDFSEKVDSRLGLMYDLAVKIVYHHSMGGEFDEDRWMLEHGQISISKHKPYPDIIYSLSIRDAATKKEESFNFAIKGRYSIYEIGQPTKTLVSKGYCRTKDNNCYVNVDQGDCAKSLGEWSNAPFQDAQCRGMGTMPEPECKGDECKNCGKRENGESWCEYEGIVSPGFSLVGSRHYKGSCINGKIYYTECRDYREEICLENTDIDVPKAVCRPNRWQDCAEQGNEEDCMDNSARDCWWSGWLELNRQGKCLPYIPPGFAHWQQNGQEVCAMANEQYDCGYYTCGKSWVDSSAIYCYNMGDCGNYRNTEDEITKQGFFNFDSTPSDYVYLTDDQLKTEMKPKLKMEAAYAPVLDGKEYENPHGTINELINNEVRYFDEVSNWRFEDFRTNYLLTGKIYIHVLQTALCMPWQAPYKGDDCKECGSLNRPCTEYKCRSLGQTCTYEEVNGIGFCYDYSEKDDIPPKIFFDGVVFGDVKIERDVFGKTVGYKFSKPLEPNTIVVFSINATEPVKCKVTSLPQPEFDQIPLPAPGTFQDYYTFVDIVPKAPDFRIGLMKSLGVNNFLELGTFETYDDKFKKIIYDARKFVKEFKGGMNKEFAEQNIQRLENMWNDDIAPNIKKAFENLGDTLRDVAVQTEQGNKLVFFKCIDKAGNENTEDLFIKYRIGKDESAPVLMAALPVNNTNISSFGNLSLYTNEPANCRFAGSDMPYDSMPLKTETECTLPLMIGAFKLYECTPRDINASSDIRTNIYVRCKDNPLKVERYIFNLTKGDALIHLFPENAMTIDLRENDRIINLTMEFEQYFTFPKVKDIMVNADEYEMIIQSIRDDIDCGFSETPGLSVSQMVPMACEKGGLEGTYQCRHKVNVQNNMLFEIACRGRFQEEKRNTAKESAVLSYLNLP